MSSKTQNSIALLTTRAECMILLDEINTSNVETLAAMAEMDKLDANLEKLEKEMKEMKEEQMNLERSAKKLEAEFRLYYCSH
jgi:cell division protein FtsB